MRSYLGRQRYLHTLLLRVLILFNLRCYQAVGEGGEDEEGDYRKASQFHTHLKKSEAASEFSRTKTMAEQRRFLPVYQVRSEMLA